MKSGGPQDISINKDSQPVQPRDIKFPVHMIGKQYRAFNSSLYDRYPQIEYSQSEDAIYCYHCRHFSTNRKEATFISQGLRNWKKCQGTKGSNNKLLQHKTSHQHGECIDSHVHYVSVKTGTFQSVAELQDSEHAKLVRENRNYMRTLCEVLLLTAQRKIGQCETGGSYRVDDIVVENLDFIHHVVISSPFFPSLRDTTQLLLNEFDLTPGMRSIHTIVFRTPC